MHVLTEEVTNLLNEWLPAVSVYIAAFDMQVQCVCCVCVWVGVWVCVWVGGCVCGWVCDTVTQYYIVMPPLYGSVFCTE